MLSTRDLFYGQTEPVWIRKAEKKEKDEDDGKDDNKKAGNNPSSGTGEKGVSYPSVSVFVPFGFINPYQLPYSPEFMVPTPAPKETKDKSETDSESKDKKKKETEVVMKVPICCSECEESVKVALYGLKGVKSVDCFSYKGMVKVVATSAAPADILLECRKLFKQSRMWKDDDI